MNVVLKHSILIKTSNMNVVFIFNYWKLAPMIKNSEGTLKFFWNDERSFKKKSKTFYRRLLITFTIILIKKFPLVFQGVDVY